MSGFERGSDDRWQYQLSRKHRSWHSHRLQDGTCPLGCRDFDEMWERHLQPAGFERVPHRLEGLCILRGLSLDQGSTVDLWEALSGRPGEAVSWDPNTA